MVSATAQGAWPRPGIVVAPARADFAIALVVMLVLGTVWTVQGWSDIAQLRLGDTDDMMRLQQVRDWLGGQAWSDLRQYRLGPPGGLAMHWSRLVDLPLAAIVLVLRPLFGDHAAQVAAVVAVPLLYLFAQLLLIGDIGRRLGGVAVGRTAMIVAALGYPAVSQFAPGRIDHHGLQLVLLTACVQGMVAAPGRWRGFAIGAAMFASIAIGLEMLVLLAVVAGWAVFAWWRGQPGADTRLAGIGLGLGAMAALGGALIPATSPIDLCDAINPALRLVMVVSGVGAMILGVEHARIPAPRLVQAGLVAALIAALAAIADPACLNGPYGAVDPLLERLWLANVAEAVGLTALPVSFGIAFAGLLVTGLVATLAQARTGGGAWWGLAVLLAAALAVSCLQLRGVNPGAALAAPGLAAMIVGARGRSVLSLALAWLLSAGILYPIAGALIGGEPEGAALTDGSCTGPAQLRAIGALPPGRMVAPIDIGAFAIAATPHASLSAPYHRNNIGNAGMYRFFLAPEAEARTIADRFDISYVAWCGGAFSEVKLDREAAPDALARRLGEGRPPAWLVPVKDSGLRVWRIAPHGR